MFSKEDLIFINGTYTIQSSAHRIDANDSIRIKDGDFDIETQCEDFSPASTNTPNN